MYHQELISSPLWRMTMYLRRFVSSIILLSLSQSWSQLRLDVLESDSLPEVRPYIPGTPLSPASPMTLPYPITLSAVQKIDFYMPRQAFNLIGMFKNPMMMMMLVGGALVFAMPYIMVSPSHYLSYSDMV